MPLYPLRLTGGGERTGALSADAESEEEVRSASGCPCESTGLNARAENGLKAPSGRGPTVEGGRLWCGRV